MKFLVVFSAIFLTSCGGLSWNTEVAATRESRLAMASTVIPGATTETGFTTRWGNPTQKVREGGQTELVYRSMTNPPGWYAPQFGDSRNYVIVTFQYGLATGVRTSDGIDCRATFPPRPPSFGYDNPSTVRLVGGCAAPMTLEESARKGPLATVWNTMQRHWSKTRDQIAGGGSAQTASAETVRPPVASDAYVGSGKTGLK